MLVPLSVIFGQAHIMAVTIFTSDPPTTLGCGDPEIEDVQAPSIQ